MLKPHLCQAKPELSYNLDTVHYNINLKNEFQCTLMYYMIICMSDTATQNLFYILSHNTNQLASQLLDKLFSTELQARFLKILDNVSCTAFQRYKPQLQSHIPQLRHANQALPVVVVFTLYSLSDTIPYSCLISQSVT